MAISELVSVIIPTRGRPQLLRRALGSLRAQKFAQFETIVVGDTDVLLSRLAEEYSDINLKYHETPERRGMGAARNLALQRSEGRWICYLDDDDSLAPDHLANLVNALKSGVGEVVYCDYKRIYERRDENDNATFDSEVSLAVGPITREIMLVQNVAPICCVMHERKCLEKVGKFDEWLPVLEDYDFWLRFLLAGYRFHHVDGATAKVHSDLIGRQVTAQRFQEFPKIQEMLHQRYYDAAKDSPRILADRQRFLRIINWRARLAEAFLKNCDENRKVEIRAGELLYGDGFFAELNAILAEANAALPLLGGKAALLKQLAKEFVEYPPWHQ